MAIHHWPENRYSLPTWISVPSDGVLGGSPTPRKLSVASVTIASAKFTVASTSTGPSVLGNTCVSAMASGWRSIKRAAST